MRCDQLSGGQLQRVGIARVSLPRSTADLADQPVSALDPTLALETVQLLVQEAKARNATLVASLHAVELARTCFDRLIGIRDGRIAFDVPAADVRDAQLQALYAAEAASVTVAPIVRRRCCGCCGVYASPWVPLMQRRMMGADDASLAQALAPCVTRRGHAVCGGAIITLVVLWPLFQGEAFNCRLCWMRTICT